MAKFKVGDPVIVPEGKGTREWWVGKPAVIRAVLEDNGMYEVLFEDAQDFAFIEEDQLELLPEKQPSN
jgi:hypothetical protein